MWTTYDPITLSLSNCLLCNLILIVTIILIIKHPIVNPTPVNMEFLLVVYSVVNNSASQGQCITIKEAKYMDMVVNNNNNNTIKDLKGFIRMFLTAIPMFSTHQIGCRPTTLLWHHAALRVMDRRWDV